MSNAVVGTDTAEREQKLQDELTELKDNISHLQQQLQSATDRETSLQQQLKEIREEVKQRDDMIKKGEDDTDKEETLQNDLTTASVTSSETSLHRPQSTVSADGQPTVQEEVTLVKKKEYYNKLGKFYNSVFKCLKFFWIDLFDIYC